MRVRAYVFMQECVYAYICMCGWIDIRVLFMAINVQCEGGIGDEHYLRIGAAIQDVLQTYTSGGHTGLLLTDF